MRRTHSISLASKIDGLPGFLWLIASGALTGFCLQGIVAPTFAGVDEAILTACPMLAMLGFFPFLLFIRFRGSLASGFGGAAWGAGAALFAAGSEPAICLAYVAGPAAFAAIASLLTRHFGYRALVITLLWVLVELAMMASGLAPRGMLASLAEGSALFSGVAAWLGSIHVALLLVLVTSGAVRVAAGIIRPARRRWPLPAGVHRVLRSVYYQVPLQIECGRILIPRAPPLRT